MAQCETGTSGQAKPPGPCGEEEYKSGRVRKNTAVKNSEGVKKTPALPVPADLMKERGKERGIPDALSIAIISEA